MQQSRLPFSPRALGGREVGVFRGCQHSACRRLYAVAWLRPAPWASDLAGVALIAGACLALTGLVAGVAPRSWLTGGLVLLVVLDVILVWGDRQVEPTMNALLSATPPTIGRPLPELQQVEFGSATMGWLDFAAPALLGLLVQRRAVAGIATGIAASLWGLLLLATSPIAATPPVLVGLIAGRKTPRSIATGPISSLNERACARAQAGYRSCASQATRQERS